MLAPLPPALGSSRLQSFSDAVFAFSATLLVVSLEVPTTFPALLEDLKGFAAFGVCFAALAVIWTIHRAYFRRFPEADRWATLINMVLLFVVLFYVYPLKFLVESSLGPLVGTGSSEVALRGPEDLGLLFALYGGGFVALFGSVAGLYARAAWRVDEGARADEAWFYARHYGIFVAVGLVSVALALGSVGLGWGAPGFAYVLLGPLCFAHGVQTGARSDAEAGGAEAGGAEASPAGSAEAAPAS
jgi:hypothetical protein